MTSLVWGDTYKLWKDFMTFAYYGGPEAVQGLKLMHEKGEKLTKNALAHANCTLFFTSRAAFVCKKKTRSFRVFSPEN